MKDLIGRHHRPVDFNPAGVRQDFPVMDGARLIGGDLLKEPAERGRNLSAQQAMRTEFEIASPSNGFDGPLTRMHQGECRGLTVVENEKVVGLVITGYFGGLSAPVPAGPPAIGS
jgi:hypothetical protein